MARFVDLEEDDVEPPEHGGKPVWNGLLPRGPVDTASHGRVGQAALGETPEHEGKELSDRTARESVTEASNPNRSAMIQALGCYP